MNIVKDGRKKVAFLTLGCKVNQYETEAMKESFQADGYNIVNFEEHADVYVINTCTVTKLSDRKSRQQIRKAKKMNPHSLVAVVGCYAQVSPEEVQAIEGVNLVLGTAEKANIVKHVATLQDTEQLVLIKNVMQEKEFEDLSITHFEGRTRAFIKVQDGCNQFCSYCIIPYARGRIRSRKLSDVVEEVKKLVENGYKEFVLTGIHVASYGLDCNSSLIALIEAIGSIEGVERLRMSSVSPLWLTDDVVGRLGKIDAFCPHFHLSLQSGSDTVLKRMNRKYTSADYLAASQKIRSVFPDAALTTDIIVGFPGETEEEFQETLTFVETINFAQVHVFKFSPREGTPAENMKNQLHGDVKSQRSQQLIEKCKESQHIFMKRFIGTSVEVLVEKVDEMGRAEGYTRNYIRVQFDNYTANVNETINVSVIGYNNDVLLGNIDSNFIDNML